MFKFLKESIKEFDHVVWPTNKETKKYFTSVSWFLLAFTLFIFLFTSIFSNSLIISKDLINPATNTNLDQLNDLNLDDLISTGSTSGESLISTGASK